MTSDLQLNEFLLDSITATLDLRKPNRDAAESVVAEISQFLDVEGGRGTFTAVVDAATAVGKTYTMAALIDYLAMDREWTDFVIVTPGKIVRDKTIDNFTHGHERSLLAGMQSRIEVITAENFDTLSVANVMDDPSIVKVYVLTIQALTAPPAPKEGKEGETKKDVKKKTRTFQESFGAGFYDRLRAVEDLVILADEYHAYQKGKVFKSAIDELEARVVIGLTATPKDKNDRNIVYRYPLAAAIAEQYVKVPVIVGRRDDRDDLRTQLLDGLALVEAKRTRADEMAEVLGRRINPIMLVTAQDIDDARRVEEMITAPDFADGQYADAVIRVDSSKADSDDDWEHLQHVEDPDSHVRVVVSVGMLKEGWDVKNVYVMLSTRASVSEMLTEQTLGRGLRLPYGKRTRVEMLDTLEVLFHEKYDALLKNAGVIAEEFVSFRTRSRAKRDALGRKVIDRVKEKVEPRIEDKSHEPVGPVPAPVKTTASTGESTGIPAGDQEGFELEQPATLEVTDIGSRLEELENDSKEPVSRQLALREDIAADLRFPHVIYSAAPVEFSLTDITDFDAFRELGRKIAAEPDRFLRRYKIDAKVTDGMDGSPVAQVVTKAAEDQVAAAQERVPVTEAIRKLVSEIMRSDVVSSRADMARQERNAARDIVDAFVEGLNGEADTLLAAYHQRAASRLVQLLLVEQSKWRGAPRFDKRVDWKVPVLRRTLTRSTSSDLTTRLSLPEFRSRAYVGFTKSGFEADWFDTHPERDMARLLDSEQNPIDWWIRLQQGDLPIRIDEGNTNYHPDFVSRDKQGRMWVIEVKGDDKTDDAGVKAKRDAAIRWANLVNSNRGENDPKWGYVLAFEKDIDDARDSWPALLRLTGAR